MAKKPGEPLKGIQLINQQKRSSRLLAEERQARSASYRSTPRARPNVPGVDVAGRQIRRGFVGQPVEKLVQGTGKELALRSIPMRTRVIPKGAKAVGKGAVGAAAKGLAKKGVVRTALGLGGRLAGAATGPIGATIMGLWLAYDILDGLGAFDSGGEKRAEALELKTQMEDAMTTLQAQQKAEGVGRLAGTLEGIVGAREEADAVSLGVPGLDQVVEENLADLQQAVPPMRPTQAMLAAAMGLSPR